MIARFRALLSMIWLVGAASVGAANQDDIPVDFSGRDPNWNVHSGNNCDLCHMASEPEPGVLRAPGDYDRMCSCHDERAELPHPSGFKPSPAMLDRIPEEFPLFDGRVNCATCHEIGRLCEHDIDKQHFTRVQGDDPSTVCYQCHDVAKYHQNNPHQQLTAKGVLVRQKCLYCHETVPRRRSDTFEVVTFISEIEALCVRCHPMSVGHPAGGDHMVVPSTEALARMMKLETEHGIILPLTREGKVSCITCHNPHEKGVIPEERAAAKGADSEQRKRLPGALCMECHQK